MQEVNIKHFKHTEGDSPKFSLTGSIPQTFWKVSLAQASTLVTARARAWVQCTQQSLPVILWMGVWFQERAELAKQSKPSPKCPCNLTTHSPALWLHSSVAGIPQVSMSRPYFKSVIHDNFWVGAWAAPYLQLLCICLSTTGFEYLFDWLGKCQPLTQTK